MAGLHVLGNFWKLSKFFKNLGTFCFWANFPKNWAKMNIFWAIFFPHTFELANKFVQFTAWKNAVLHHLKFLWKFYPKKICPIHAVQPISVKHLWRNHGSCPIAFLIQKQCVNAYCTLWEEHSLFTGTKIVLLWLSMRIFQSEFSVQSWINWDLHWRIQGGS